MCPVTTSWRASSPLSACSTRAALGVARSKRATSQNSNQASSSAELKPSCRPWYSSLPWPRSQSQNAR